MQIDERKVTVGEVCDGYFNDAEEGVVGYNERLDIRPKYQREFVYKDKQRDEVIRTVMKGLPLNVIYWCKTGEDSYEVLDGQQRTISLCEYVDGSFSVDDKYFYNLPEDQKRKILDYQLFVYVCDGTDSEKLDWFRIINIAGEQLTDQELRNAVYAGSWTSDAKRYFSKTGCAASTLAGDYLKGASIRQEYLETAISWAAAADGKTIEASARTAVSTSSFPRCTPTTSGRGARAAPRPPTTARCSAATATSGRATTDGLLTGGPCRCGSNRPVRHGAPLDRCPLSP